MKKDHSQPFLYDPTNYYLLVADETSKHFVILSSTNDGETFLELPRFTRHSESDIAQQVVRVLYPSLAVNSYRELAGTSSVIYGYADETPGRVQPFVCLYVEANLTDAAQESDVDLRLVPLRDLLPILRQEPFVHPLIELGVAKLLSEREQLEA